MLMKLNNMSLRTRLWVLAVLTVGALVVAMFVAWRLARATETFALLQAEGTLHTTAMSLARDLARHPQGRLSPQSEDAGHGEAIGNSRPAQAGRARRASGHLPPHERAAFAAYSDPLQRLTAIALHRHTEISGGFIRTDGVLVGRIGAQVSADELAALQSLAQQASAMNDAATRSTRTENGIVLMEAYPVEDESRDAGGALVAAWTIRRLSNLTGATDSANIIALLLLLAAVIGVTALAFTTVRDLSRGVGGIERGLTGLSSDLNTIVSTSRTPELRRITTSINDLAASLRANIAHGQELEREVRRGERLAALGRVVAGVAHEVRNPLAAMRLKLQIAQRGNALPDKLTRTFQVVLEEIDRLDSLVRRLLELGRPPALAVTAFDLFDLAHQRAALLAEVAARQNVRIVTVDKQDEYPSAPVRIEADQDRLAQVLDNLLQNALEAMPEGGTLTIRCVKDALCARLRIADTGVGVSIDAREHIFEPFYTGRADGTGLGLAIAREIVEAHGGTIQVESHNTDKSVHGNDAAGGTAFIVELPLKMRKDFVDTALHNKESSRV
ncbi:MAG: ATP-binding protein [Acidobacteriota bacterium]|nr:ATP-binding protein [Acidobacteriota bacterium]